MRFITGAAAAIFVLAGFACAQSNDTQPAHAQSAADEGTREVAVNSASDAKVEARLVALEQKIQQLELENQQLKAEQIELRNRINAASQVRPAPTSAPVDLSSRLEEIGERGDLLQHNANAKEAPGVTAGRDTFSIVSPDKNFRLRFGGHVQMDGKSFIDRQGVPLINVFNIRRARAILEGDLGRFVSFRFMPEFGNGSNSIYDAYADLKLTPYTVLRGGKFKTPLGLELLQNDADRTFIEQSLTNNLVPNRDEGFQLYGDIRGRLAYQAAVLNGAPAGGNIDGIAPTGATTHNGKDVVGRIFATPFARGGQPLLKGLGFGIAASTGRQDENAVLPNFKSAAGQATFFTYSGTQSVTNIIADGRRLTYSPQAHYYAGPFGLMAEYVTLRQQIAGTNAAGEMINQAVDDHAWQIAGSWVITGEQKTFRGVVPRTGLEGGNIPLGIGAWELAARYSELTIDPTAFTVGFADSTKSANSARAWCVGLNWYLNYFTRLAFNYEQTRFGQGAVIGNRPTEHAVMERLQIAF
ncbi:MAG: porin [Terriglobia bacterium]|nr:porin [Terriglobia bacterium]